MSKARKAKPAPATPEVRHLVECSVNDIVETSSGPLIVCGRVDGSAILVRRWDREAKREGVELFGMPEDTVVFGVSRKPPPPPTIGGDFDPLKGA